MKQLLGIEYAALFLLGISLAYHFSPGETLPLIGLIALGVFFLPDIAMVFYLLSPKLGAWGYNLLHHQAFCVALILIGTYFGNDITAWIGSLFLAHSAFDRMFGYGLKYTDNFHHTHLGNLK